jgi:hypothetical protein
MSSILVREGAGFYRLQTGQMFEVTPKESVESTHQAYQ